ncbi:MAG: protein kinase [Planctomycetes bacterium]|nr:protein kinase [Planctomycetota bacterium]
MSAIPSPSLEGPASDDELFLDQLFERAVAEFEAGGELELDALLVGRGHLRSAVESVLRTAREATLLQPSAPPLVRGFTVVREIGRGGMGAVYLARQHTVAGRAVALKVLPGVAMLAERARRRFLTEAHAIAQVRHPNIVTVYDVVADDGACAYAMEWVDGASLAQVIAHLASGSSGGRRTSKIMEFLSGTSSGDDTPYPVFMCRLAIALARALEALHAAGLVHRDVKPSNVLLRRDATPLLSDFGLVHESAADLTQRGQFVGTVAYASPEQLGGEPESLDARSDVYALGVTLYHALTLRLPFEHDRASPRHASTPTGMLALIESRSAVPLRSRDPGLPRDLETIVAKAMANDPEQRYASAGEFADDLERLLSLRPIVARRPAPWTRAAMFIRRHRAATSGLVAGTALTLALSLAAIVYLFLAPRWVDEHVRDARLALLDPTYANMLFAIEAIGATPGRVDPLVGSAALERAVGSYDAALGWSWFDDALRGERDVVAAALAGRPATHDDTRLRGLAAYLAGDTTVAVECWHDFERERDASGDADPLVSSLLGFALLVREEPARAYPRLREACAAFPDVGFLTTYCADAAVGCGDFEVAQRLLDAARTMPWPDPLGGLERVQADWLAATGREAEALELFRATAGSPVATLHHARLLSRLGRTDQALECYGDALRRMRGQRATAGYRAALEDWWSGLEAGQRHIELIRGLELGPWASNSLIARLQLAFGSPPPAESSRRRRNFTALAHRPSARSLQSFGLPELAEVLEVDDMEHWNRIPGYSPSHRRALLAAWHLPLSRLAVRAVHALAQREALADSRQASVALSAALLCASAAAQNCPNAPCFQGLGDLPGGATYSHANCISGDGTHVGGASTAAASNGAEPYEPFVWDAVNGMVHLGDLPGGTNSGEVHGISDDGSVAAGWSASSNCTWQPDFVPTFAEAFRWTVGGGLTALGDSAGGHFFSIAYSLSGDGSEAAGISNAVSVINGNPTPFSSRWTGAGWTIDGGVNCVHSMYTAMSRNGVWYAGRQINVAGGQMRLIRRSVAAGYQTLLSVPHVVASGSAYLPYGVSDDGILVGGNYTTSPASAFKWTAADGLMDLPDLLGGTSKCRAQATTRDGSLSCGFGTSSLGQEAVIWDGLCVYRLHDVLVLAGVSIPTGWLLSDCTGIVENAGVLSVCGTGFNPIGNTEAFVAHFVWPWTGAGNYCTAGTTTNGCNASMSATGSPSVSSTSGFTLTCSNVEGQKFGLIFYGLSGPKASAWTFGSTSYLCVKAPVQRTPSENSGGTAGACDGAFSIDFLTYLSTHPGALGQPFSEGLCVNAQAWFRDPPAPGTTNLSDAVQFDTLP